MQLLRRIERYIKDTGTPPTRLGREMIRDPRFVFDLRRGREPRVETEARLQTWLDARGARK